MKLTDGEDTTISKELEESVPYEAEIKGEEENETDETGEAGEQETNESIESAGEGSEEETEDGVSEGFDESIEQTTTIEVSLDSIPMDTALVSLGFVPVALFFIIFLLGIIALGGD